MGKNTHDKNFSETAVDILLVLLDIVVSLYMLLITAVLPLYFQSGYEHIGSDKSYFFRQVSFKIGILAYALLLLYILFRLSAGRCSIHLIMRRLSVTDIFAVIYAVGVVLSYFCSEYKEEALIGTEKWYMGTLPQLTFVSIYFFVSRFWKKHIWIPAMALLVSCVVFLLGILNRFGIFPIDMKIHNAAFISTIGNINWYCGYAVTVFFAGISVWWLSASIKKAYALLFAAYTAIGFATLVTQGSDSGLFTLALVLIVMLCLSARWTNMLRFAEIICILSAACVLTGLIAGYTPFGEAFEQNITEYPMVRVMTGSSITVIMAVTAFAFLLLLLLYKRGGRSNISDNAPMFKRVRYICAGAATLAGITVTVFTVVNTCMHGSLTSGAGTAVDSILNFTIDWGSGRGASVRAAVWSFAEQNLLHKLVGVGADCMSAYIYGSGSDRVLSVVTEKFGTLRLTNAHNEWLTILLNQGILGVVSFAGMICSAIYRYINKREVNVIAAACGMGVLAYTLNNIFSFQTSVNTPTMFIMLGMGEGLMRNAKHKRKQI
ncbi:MAG: O-antigen ligase family protein [Lachnospiraceae bacterium]|nr:O-antigen ligase family protein [Lachnospiraceae bacterium]